jgi:trans-aconitate methyltransferase
MFLNRVEKAMMNNSVLAALQHHLEAPQLRAMGGAVPVARMLEVGCGRGVGTELILDLFGGAQVDAFDPETATPARECLCATSARDFLR